MKLLIILLLATLWGCSGGSGTQTTLSVSKSFSIGAQTGGLIIYINNKTKNTTTAISLIDTTHKITLEHGEYEFKAAGWDGSIPLEGALKCGATTANLKDPAVQVEIPISAGNCSNSNFSTAPIRLISCLSLSSITASGMYCDDSARGSTGSYRIRLPASNQTLSGDCFPATAAPNGTTYVSEQIPGTFETDLETYTSDDCSGTKITHKFKQGIAYPSTTADSISYLNGSERDIYVKHNTQSPITLSSISITSTNPNPIWAKLNDTVKVNFTSSVLLTGVTGTINGLSASLTDHGGGQYTLEKIVSGSDIDGVVSFNITYNGQSFNQTTDMTGVNVDKTISDPILSLANPVSSPGIEMFPTIMMSGLELNASVDLYFTSNCTGPIASTTASSGTATLSSPGLSPGVSTYYGKQKDLAGNESNCAGPLVYEYQPITITSLNFQSNNPNSAWATIGDEIIITFTASTNNSFTVMVGATPINATLAGGTNYQASYTVNGSEPDGQFTISITGPGGPYSLPTGPSLFIDTVAPSEPLIALKAPTLAADFKETPTFTIDNVEPGNLVKIYNDSACSIYNVGATSGGTSIDLTVNPLTVATYSFYTRQYDQAGNASPCSTTSATYRLKQPFVSVWQVAANETVTLPFLSGNTYNYEIDWGDGSAKTISTNYIATHTYVSANQYTITIKGTVEAWSFNGTGSNLSIREVTNFGELGWKNLYGAFKGCSNLTVFNGGDFSQVHEMGSMFADAPTVIPNTSMWNTSSVTNMASLFYNASSANPDTSGWDTSSVTSMQSMFEGATSANPDVATWNVSNVTHMGRMFMGATTANPNTSTWVTSNVTQMYEMFKYASSANPDVSNWDTINVVSMDSMFSGATIADPDTTTWDIQNVLYVDNMFTSSGISNANWSKFIIMADATNNHAGLTISSPAKYNASAVTAWTSLSARWTIYDAGPE